MSKFETPEAIWRAEETMSEEEKKMSGKREWVMEHLKSGSGGGAHIIGQAREMMVPEERIKDYALRLIEANTRQGYDPAMAFRMAENTGIAVSGEVEEVVRRTYRNMLRENPSDFYAAEYLFGKGSPEYLHARELDVWEQEEKKKKWKEAKWKVLRRDDELVLSLSPNVTFGDLFEALNSDEEGVDALSELFWSEVYDNFSQEIQEDLQRLHLNDPELAKKTSVPDFLKERGYSRKDLEAFLPIKFKQERKKK